MRWRKLKKVIMEHPYLISDDFHMSMQQAKDLQEEEGYPFFEEMVECARKRSLLPDSAWQGVYTVIQEEAKSNVEQPHQRLFWRRLSVRWAIAGLCILLITGYFTLVPSGKALAASIARIVVEFFDDGLRFSSMNTQETSQQTGLFEETVSEFSDFDMVEKETGRKFLQIKGDKFILEGLQLYNSTHAGQSLYSFYGTSDGLSVSLYHTWEIAADYWAQINQNDYVWEEHLTNGTTVYCSINTADSVFTGYAIWNDMLITIYADDGVEYRDVLSAIE